MFGNKPLVTFYALPQLVKFKNLKGSQGRCLCCFINLYKQIFFIKKASLKPRISTSNLKYNFKIDIGQMYHSY